MTRSSAGVQPIGDGSADPLRPNEAELPLDLWVHDLSIDHRAKPVDHEAQNDDDPARCTEQFGLRILWHSSLVNKCVGTLYGARLRSAAATDGSTDHGPPEESIRFR